MRLSVEKVRSSRQLFKGRANVSVVVMEVHSVSISSLMIVLYYYDYLILDDTSMLVVAFKGSVINAVVCEDIIPDWHYDVPTSSSFLTNKELDAGARTTLNIKPIEEIELTDLHSIHLDNYNPFTYYTLQSNRLSRHSLQAFFSTRPVSDMRSTTECIAVTDRYVYFIPLSYPV
jgi:hypothetical protein